MSEYNPKYPNRGTPVISPTEGFNFIVVERAAWNVPEGFRFTKEHSCYLRPTGFKAGVCPDYRTFEKAKAAADRCNAITPDGDYIVVNVAE